MSTSDSSMLRRLEVARAAAIEAGRHTLQFFGKGNYQVERKADQSPVTVADREAEQLLRERITASFPEDGIIGEELGTVEGTSGYCWVLDPIDGTKSFICGVPLYGTLVGVQHEGRGVIGVIYMPALDECLYAAQGHEACYGPATGPFQPAHVSSCTDLGEAVFVTSQVDSFDKRGAGEVFRRLQGAARITRTWGDCYGYLLVATGRAELMVDPIMEIWDAAAIQPILEAAGGTFTNWGGQPTAHSREGIGTNGRLLDQVLAVTGPFARR